ncbi:MAG: hypothetical protein ACYDHZ_09280 [Dehalococcoidia bacterium]
MEFIITWIPLLAGIAALVTAIAALHNALLSRREVNARLRAWVGVSKWTSCDIPATSAEGPYYWAGVTVQNFGTLPATDIGIACCIYYLKDRQVVVERKGLLLWPGQCESLQWSISPPISKETEIVTEIVIDYRGSPSVKSKVHTKEMRRYYTPSMKFIDFEEGQSYAT